MTINNERLAKFEGQKWHKRNEINPDYASSADYREQLWLYLVGKEEMWKEFDNWAWEQSGDLITTKYVPWLTLPLDGVPRWVSLLSDWLGLESVRERFGWVECHGCDGKDSVPIECSEGNKECGGSGKIRAEWAKV